MQIEGERGEDEQREEQREGIVISRNASTNPAQPSVNPSGQSSVQPPVQPSPEACPHPSHLLCSVSQGAEEGAERCCGPARWNRMEWNGMECEKYIA